MFINCYIKSLSIYSIYVYEATQASIFFLFLESDDIIKTSSSVGFPGNV